MMYHILHHDGKYIMGPADIRKLKDMMRPRPHCAELRLTRINVRDKICINALIDRYFNRVPDIRLLDADGCNRSLRCIGPE